MQQMLLWIGIGLFLFLFLWWQGRSRNKTMTKFQEFQDSLVPGDRVVTTSGLHASVHSVQEGTLLLEIAPGVVTEWIRLAVRERAEPHAVDEAAPQVEAQHEEDDAAGGTSNG